MTASHEREGAPIEYPEFDLRFKTDSTPDGAAPGTLVVMNAGMKGDRGFVVFSAPGEISTFIKPERQRVLTLANSGISR